MADGKCSLCDRQAKVFNKEGDWNKIKCETCGSYEITGLEILGLTPLSKVDDRRYLLSAHTKLTPNVRIDKLFLKRLEEELRDKSIEDKLELVARSLAQRSLEFGQSVASNFDQDYPMAYCKSSEEWNNLLIALVKLGYLEKLNEQPSNRNYTLTVDGWRWLAPKPDQLSNEVFVAMNFDPSFQGVRSAILNAIQSASYQPVIIDEKIYTGGIMDRILAQIRRCRFAVADYTGNRGGVYYEAGFAFGLGKTVISTCKQDQLNPANTTDRLHFDVAHLKMIPWENNSTEKLKEFSDRLKSHILALFGQGTHLAS
jgi:hypothetical protein